MKTKSTRHPTTSTRSKGVSGDDDDVLSVTFRGMFDRCQTAMVVTSPQPGHTGDILYGNAAFERLTGYTADEYRHRDCHFLSEVPGGGGKLDARNRKQSITLKKTLAALCDAVHAQPRRLAEKQQQLQQQDEEEDATEEEEEEETEEEADVEEEEEEEEEDTAESVDNSGGSTKKSATPALRQRVTKASKTTSKLTKKLLDKMATATMAGGDDDVDRAQRRLRSLTTTLFNYRKSGEMFVNELTIIPITHTERDPDTGRDIVVLTAYVGYLRDVTFKYRFEQLLMMLLMTVSVVLSLYWFWYTFFRKHTPLERAKETLHDIQTTVTDTVTSTIEKVSDAGGNIAHKVADTAHDMADKVRGKNKKS